MMSSHFDVWNISCHCTNLYYFVFVVASYCRYSLGGEHYMGNAVRLLDYICMPSTDISNCFYLLCKLANCHWHFFFWVFLTFNINWLLYISLKETIYANDKQISMKSSQQYLYWYFVTSTFYFNPIVQKKSNVEVLKNYQIKSVTNKVPYMSQYRQLLDIIGRVSSYRTLVRYMLSNSAIFELAVCLGFYILQKLKTDTVVTNRNILQ